jgi:hypothetical protein
MHDPSTVAFEIKSPFRDRPSKMWPKGYRNMLVTIWHEDPLKFEGKWGCRSDDSCGWFNPPMTVADNETIKKLAKEQYGQIFEKQVRTAEGASYAHICNEPDCVEAVYWAWRAIKHKFKPRGLWQWGCRLSAGEVVAIYDLATCPNDNLKHTFRSVRDADSFYTFFHLVYRAYTRHHRPWYRHPRWHFWHWRFQIHAWQKFRRWAFSRCAGCGKGFSYGYSPTSFSWDSKRPGWFRSEEGIYHSECAGMTAHLHREPVQGSA